MNVTVLGAGTWGTALAALLAEAHTVTLWSALPDELTVIENEHRHPHLPSELPHTLRTERAMPAAVKEADIVIIATPSAYVRATARAAAPYLREDCTVASAAKGIEEGTHLTMTEIIEQELRAVRGAEAEAIGVGALSGPTHAEEVARGVPTSMVAACADEAVARRLSSLFVGTCMRVYTNTDVRGVQIAGAVKNVIALAAGMHRGMGFGDNTLAMLLTRGIAEITRLGVALGCRRDTFMGLSGIGDLIVTCTSHHSRNNRCGELIGRGMTYEAAAAEIGMVVEGYHALRPTLTLARACGVEMPITEAVAAVLSGKLTAREATEQLMRRSFKTENE